LLGRTLWVSGDYAASLEAYEEGVRIAPRDQALIRARALAGLGQVYMLHSRHAEARRLCEEAISEARAVGARDLEGHGLNTLAVALAGLGHIRAANESIAAALAIALDLGIPDDIGRAFVNRADIEHWSGDPERALQTSLDGMQVAADWGVASSYGAWLGYGGVTVAFETGRWAEASRLMAEADRVVGSPEATWFYRTSYVMELLAYRGDPGLGSLWERARRTPGRSLESDNDAVILQAAIAHLTLAGRLDEALSVVREALELVESVATGFRTAELARVAAWPVADAGRAARSAGAQAGIREARSLMGRLVDLSGAWRITLADPGERLTRILSLDADEVARERTRLEGTDGPDDWAAMADAWSSAGRPLRAAMARWREAGSAEEAGERARAAEALREAHHIGRGLGAAPLLAVLEVMARRLRVRIADTDAAPGTRSGSPYGLTPREREVLSGVAAGHTNRQIAEALFISESTAGVHVSNILGKLGVSTRTEAARAALEQGLVES
jgi:DNA-binding CsgD family transcriptional regulator/tetratricopeptide (TPR) repeat protein